jgi:hypothetical protein
MLEKGKRVPDWKITDIDGNVHALWDYRQKSHLLLLFDPQASADTVLRWQKAIVADRQQWDWLQTKILIVAKAPEGMAPGAYVIDRYGMFWNYFSPGHWTFDDLEKDLVYYEARHC